MITLTTITPDYGPEAGGTAVTLSGAGFAEGMTVTVGGIALVDVVVADANTITGTTPPGALGAQEVVVIDPDVEASDSLSFCYTGTSAGWRCVRNFPDAGHVFVSGDGNGVLVLRLNVADGSIDLFKSTDRGETFVQSTVSGLTLQDTASFKYWHLFVDTTLTTILIPNGFHCLISTDGGETFTETLIDSDPEVPPWKTYATGSSDGVNLAVIGIAPEGGGYAGLCLSTDSGASWSFISQEAISIGTPMGVAISDDGLTIFVVCYGPETVICAVSEDGGGTWRTTANTRGAAIDPRVEMARDGSIIYVSNLAYEADKSLDLGDTWEEILESGVLAASSDGSVCCIIDGTD